MKRKFIFIILSVIIILLATSCTKGYRAIKITKHTQIPQVIKKTLKDIDLERGLYYFAENFTNESAYLVFCGGKEYTDSYDVELNELKYNFLIEEVSGPPRKPLYGFLKVDFKEKVTSVVYNYGIETQYPIIIYKIDGKIGEQAWPVLPPKSSLKFRKWWGSNAKVLEGDRVTCEVIESREQAPEYFENLKIEPNSKLPVGFKNGNTEYIVINNKDNKPFTITLESLNIARSINNKYLIDLVICKHEIAEPTLEYEGSPYAILKINHHKDKQYLRKLLIFDESLVWELKR